MRRIVIIATARHHCCGRCRQTLTPPVASAPPIQRSAPRTSYRRWLRPVHLLLGEVRGDELSIGFAKPRFPWSSGFVERSAHAEITIPAVSPSVQWHRCDPFAQGSRSCGSRIFPAACVVVSSLQADPLISSLASLASTSETTVSRPHRLCLRIQSEIALSSAGVALGAWWQGPGPRHSGAGRQRTNQHRRRPLRMPRMKL